MKSKTIKILENCMFNVRRWRGTDEVSLSIRYKKEPCSFFGVTSSQLRKISEACTQIADELEK